ncbi:cysteine desulfurase family protein [Sporomusa termitida]|uniref:cysteine desulfurase n=1 Tax=Sporomusa termitida TaxID=2377 RepID=A0A517DWT6_9FIRM|nr:cysteine desulfurase family protein [Sporomusa termitida]QDR81807.1 Cysteine desulfurase IscS [Sporomusa termitida]
MIYLDNSATTPIDPEVKTAMLPYLEEEYGNPSSKYYLLAENARRAVEESRAKLAELINADPDEIIFTSCASESNNMVIKGVADYKKHVENKGNHILTSSVEHKSVLQTCQFLAGFDTAIMNKEMNRFRPGRRANKIIDRGYEVSFLPVNAYGQVEKETLENSMRESTTLVSIIWGNNEIGTLNSVTEFAELFRERSMLFHSDATQVLGKVNIDVKETPIDFLSFSAHKIFGPKGIGALYIRKDKYGLKPLLTALIHGGSQEEGYRAGTLSVHNIVGFGKAAEIAKRDKDTYIPHILQLEKKLKEELLTNFPSIQFNGHPTEKIPGVISFTIPGLSNELFIKKIKDDVAMSTGSACSADEPSYVLKAIGRGAATSNTFRVTISKNEKENDINEFIKKVCTS